MLPARHAELESDSGRPRNTLQRATFLALLAIAIALAAGGCGKDTPSPVEVRVNEATGEDGGLGFPAAATKNTTRVGGKSPIEDAAGVAAAVFPSQVPSQRPKLVTLVDAVDWRGGIAAAGLTAPPLGAPILLTNGQALPEATGDALDALHPTGSAEAGAQTMSIGKAAVPGGYRNRQITGADAFALADAIDLFLSKVSGRPAENVLVASADNAAFAMPAAGWAAKSGEPVLFTRRDELPAATVRAIRRHDHPNIYVLGPRNVISEFVLDGLKRLGRVKRVGGRTPTTNSIEFARYSDGTFGWGVDDPGHGLVFAHVGRAQDAAAGAALSANGAHGPLLVTDSSDALPAALANYLLDIQPGYRFDPVRGVYNHAWLMGDESAISTAVQAKIDSLSEIARVKRQGRGV